MKLRWGRIAAVALAVLVCVTAAVLALSLRPHSSVPVASPSASVSAAASPFASSAAAAPPASSSAATSSAPAVSSLPASSAAASSSSLSPSSAPAAPQDWRLILVNADHPIPTGYTFDLMTLTNGRQVDARVWPDLQRMFDDARADGLQPMVREGYRSHEEQIAIMEERVDRYVAAGKTREEAARLAAREVAVPGTSEHELGLAVDVNIAEGDDPWPLYDWLARNAWRYGFILRYPSGKTDVTGIAYEPWHYRYVGEEAAREIRERNVTLEEYLAP